MNPLITTPAYVSGPIDAVAGRSFVVTGAAGSIGSEVCRRLCSEGGRVTGIDIDENGLTYLSDDIGEAFVPMVSDVAAWTPHSHFVGDATFIHCAARKHVALGETHRAEYIRTNVTGTLRVIQAAGDNRVVVVSTDKAVNPTCVMGQTKRLAELKALAYGHTVVRLVNVYGSRGSVVPRWHRQRDSGRACTITDWSHRRFYMTAAHAAWVIIDAATGPYECKIVVPRDYAELTTRELFDAEFGPDGWTTEVVGARPGERERETLQYDYETGTGGTLEHGRDEAELRAHMRGGEWEIAGIGV